MQLCFLEGCDQARQVTVQKKVYTRGQVGDSQCELHLPFCSVDHAAAFEHLYPTVTEQMATIARLVANFEAERLTVEQLEHTAASLVQIIDINLGGQGMVLIPREEFEALSQSKRMLASTQRKLSQLSQNHEARAKEKKVVQEELCDETP